ncbi:MAG: penicillin-binding protein 2 [Chthoniobacterales bacterium]|nr:penicillin-binding protein 2 [Chthoniobacterales bacterium]
MSWWMRWRIFLVGVVVSLVFTIYSARLIAIQVGEHGKFVELAAAKNTYRQVIPARRGRILDAKGEVLAMDRPTRRVVADSTRVNRVEELAKLASERLELPVREVEEKLRSGRRYVVLRHGVAEEVAMDMQREMMERNLRGIYFEVTSERVYPNGALLGHVLGFMNHERRGVQGIEMSMDRYLAGQDGFRDVERDRDGREVVVYRGLEALPRDGADVELTIDMAIQAILEEELEKAYRELNPWSICGVIVRPKTGEILAMGSRPNFDSNRPGEAESEGHKNRVISEVVEPGSTFKIVAMSAALNEGLFRPESVIFCENGRYFYGGRVLRDVHPYGNLTVHEVLVKSSNIGSSKLAQRVGEQKFYEYIRRFGFGEKSGVDLPGEVGGIVHPPHRWTKLSITRIPMGHEIAVTPLQIAMATAAIANGGRLMTPLIVKRIVASDGEELMTFRPVEVRRVVDERVAGMVKAAMADVVGPQGTAKLAAVAGFRVGGKTGTAQRVDPRGGYTPGKYVVSFCGFLPVGDPEFVCLIMVDDAKTLTTRNYGGLVAAPIFSRVAEKVARYLDIVPEEMVGVLTMADEQEGNEVVNKQP